MKCDASWNTTFPSLFLFASMLDPLILIIWKVSGMFPHLVCLWQELLPLDGNHASSLYVLHHKTLLISSSSYQRTPSYYLPCCLLTDVADLLVSYGDRLVSVWDVALSAIILLITSCYCPNLEGVELQFIPNRLCNSVEYIHRSWYKSCGTPFQITGHQRFLRFQIQ